MKNPQALFKAKLCRPAKTADDDALWAFIILPKSESDKLPRRGRTSVEGTINGQPFLATLEPDGKLSHWLKLDQNLLEIAGASVGDNVALQINPVAQEPEPAVPTDLQNALNTSAGALSTWKETTTIARLDWIHWITTAKQAKTRDERIKNACAMLSSGKKRVCCFDPSGFYSKAISAPKEAN